MNTPNSFRRPGSRLIQTALALPAALFLAAPAPLAAEVPHSLTAVLERAGESADVAAARYSYQSARLEATAAGYRGDLTLSLTPGLKTSWPEGEAFDPYYELTATAAATIPLGLSAAERLRLERALLRVQGAEAELRRSVLDAAAALYSSYAAAYMARREVPVLEAEYEAERQLLSAAEARYNGGEISLIELFKVREDYRRSQQALETGTVQAELALLDLLVRSGSDIPHGFGSGPAAVDTYRLISPLEELPRLEVPLLDTVLPRLLGHHPRIVAQSAALEAAVVQTVVARDPLLSSVRLSYAAADDQSGSLAYAFGRPALSLSYTPPPAGFGTEIPSRSDRDDRDKQTVTLQAVFSLGIGSERTQAGEAASAAAHHEAVRLEALERALEADIRSHYRRIDAAEATLELSHQALRRAQASLQAILARDELGLANPAETAAARAAAQRAELAVERARITLVGAQLAGLAAAHLPEALPAPVYTTLFGGLR
ncbi:MAG: hypothetical protein EA384_14200 [Spirochaetaceae bacterium]|nr:MAG: hypothetical protein EA384_14200 [Spirochaetaceae bacterium]